MTELGLEATQSVVAACSGWRDLAGFLGAMLKVAMFQKYLGGDWRMLRLNIRVGGEEELLRGRKRPCFQAFYQGLGLLGPLRRGMKARRLQ